MPANYKPFDKAEWLRLEKKADELRRLTIQTAILGRFGSPRRCNERNGRYDYFVPPFHENRR